ncbi:hypothetical protein L7F22_000425 [Adiantum nelumboides]|nr:hypothetical protein [Adiantum nelumboides]
MAAREYSRRDLGLMHRAARLYYLEELNQAAIAERLAVVPADGEPAALGGAPDRPGPDHRARPGLGRDGRAPGAARRRARRRPGVAGAVQRARPGQHAGRAGRRGAARGRAVPGRRPAGLQRADGARAQPRRVAAGGRDRHRPHRRRGRRAGGLAPDQRDHPRGGRAGARAPALPVRPGHALARDERDAGRRPGVPPVTGMWDTAGWRWSASARRRSPGTRSPPRSRSTTRGCGPRPGTYRVVVGLHDTGAPAARRRGRARPDRARGQRHRADPAARRRRRDAAAPGDPLRRRHPCRDRDRRAHRGARCRGRPGTRGHRAVVAGRRPEVAVAGPARAGGDGADRAVPDVQLLPGAPADRRVRARPPLGEPVRPDVRPARRGLGPRLGRAHRARPAAAPPAVADRDRRDRHRTGGRRDRAARGTPRHGGDRRRLGGGGERRGDRPRRGHGHVRDHDVPDRDPRLARPAPGDVDHPRGVPRHLLARGGHGDLRRGHELAARPRRRRPHRARRRRGRRRTRQRRPAPAALLRRGAHAAVRPGRPRRPRRADDRARARRDLPRGAGGHRPRGAAQPGGDARRRRHRRPSRRRRRRHAGRAVDADRHRRDRTPPARPPPDRRRVAGRCVPRRHRHRRAPRHPGLEPGRAHHRAGPGRGGDLRRTTTGTTARSTPARPTSRTSSPAGNGAATAGRR